ncbi:MAG: sugar phosphate isomerase/epimerase [Planctomycetes bacterium]|nr:sugar phosphate isomerase/epimerase [Planctomycetota bacterium]
MQIGICTNMNPGQPDRTGVEQLAAFKEAGFDFAELPGSMLLVQTPESLKRLEDQILASGIPCLALNSLVHPSFRVTGEKIDQAALDDYFQRAFSLAARIGAKHLVFGSSGARNVPFGFPMEKAWDQLVELLKRVAPWAAEKQVTLVIEHINRLEGNIVCTFAEGVKMAEQVDHPNVRCLVDHFHLGLGNETMDLVKAKFALIKHSHTSNILERTTPLPNRHEESGVKFLKEMKMLGYQGGISVEGYSKDIIGEAKEIAKFMLQYK